MTTPITAQEMLYQIAPGRAWSAEASRTFVGIGGRPAWHRLPTVAALEPVYGTCVVRGVTGDGRQEVTFHRATDGLVTVVTYQGPPLA